MSNTKIRITLFSKSDATTPVSDRLVSFSTEMAAGPKETHDGPFRLDVTLLSDEDTEQLMAYLKQLKGKMPIVDKQPKITKTTNLEKDSMSKIIDTALDKKTIDDMVTYLRDMNFAFFTHEHLKTITDKNGWAFDLKDPKHEKYQFMARVLRLAKDPKNDKIDPTIFFGIKLLGKRVDKIQVYVSGKHSSMVKMKWSDSSNINFKVKEKFYKFPEPMSYEERSKWRAEDRKVHTSNGEYEGTPFYQKWAPFVKRLQPLKLKKK